MHDFVLLLQSVWNGIGGIDALVKAGGLLGAGAAIGQLLLSRGSDKTAQRGNEIAEAGNREARTANELAEHANEIALDANSVEERSVMVGCDQTDYHWRLRVEDDGRIVALVNDCAHAADDVAVFVRSGDATICRGTFEHVPAFRILRLDMSGAVEQIVEHQRAVRSDFLRDTPVNLRIHVHVSWTCESGIRRDEVLHKIAHCQNDRPGRDAVAHAATAVARGERPSR